MGKKKIVIGIDLDNTITADENSKRFFSVLTHLLQPEYEIHIITNRDKALRQDTIGELEEIDIQYDNLMLTENKADYILREDITIYFDDTDEYFLSLPDSVLVFKIREAGNFSFSKKKWIGSEKTTKMIDKKVS